MRPEPVNLFDAPVCPPPRPYAPGGKTTTLPGDLPCAVAARLGPDAGERAEGGGLLYGRRGLDGGPDVVSAFVLPPQIRNARNYRVPREGIAAASAATRGSGWVVLGQVHTHPGINVEHSWFDDRNAISAKALSLVAPNYGADESAWLDGVGVHEFQVDWWHLLEPDRARARVQIDDVPLTVLDLRA
jgi:hypothetical protein